MIVCQSLKFVLISTENEPKIRFYETTHELLRTKCLKGVTDRFALGLGIQPAKKVSSASVDHLKVMEVDI